ncbi:hypothetical protein MP638_005859 [Amoeboaphelidium occidentale]|nr:hypothetical protein MP638_005859 [Amoeboaphelidium occidentale]
MIRTSLNTFVRRKAFSSWDQKELEFNKAFLYQIAKEYMHGVSCEKASVIYQEPLDNIKTYYSILNEVARSRSQRDYDLMNAASSEISADLDYQINKQQTEGTDTRKYGMSSQDFRFKNNKKILEELKEHVVRKIPNGYIGDDSTVNRFDTILRKHFPGLERGRVVRRLLQHGTIQVADHLSVHTLLPKTIYNFWTTDEEELLQDMVLNNYILQKSPINFSAIGAQLEDRFKSTRSALVCWRKWNRDLSPLIKKGKWSKAEHERLLAIIKEHGKNWALIGSVLYRRDDAVRLYYNNAIKRGKITQPE